MLINSMVREPMIRSICRVLQTRVNALSDYLSGVVVSASATSTARIPRANFVFVRPAANESDSNALWPHECEQP